MFLCASLAIAPVLSFAGDLRISNDSNYNFSLKINNACASKFGTLSRKTTKIIPERDFNQECQYNPAHCIARVYDSPECKGEVIADITFDTRIGVVAVIRPPLSEIRIVFEGFNLVFWTYPPSR